MTRKAKKDPNELTVEQKLETLFQLQAMLSEANEIGILRGELPLEVQDLEDEITGLNTCVDKVKAEVDELKFTTAGERAETEAAKASVEKYKPQQDNVRNDRGYDFLTKGIEFQSLEIGFCEKRIKELNVGRGGKEVGVVKNEQILNEGQGDLEQRKGKLDEIISEVKQGEEKLRDKVKDLEIKIGSRLLRSFRRIRKNSYNGLSAVHIQHDAYGGYFNKIPPQRQLDIRSRKKVIVCEYCGYIMIGPELASVRIEHRVEKTPVTTTERVIRRKTVEQSTMFEYVLESLALSQGSFYFF